MTYLCRVCTCRYLWLFFFFFFLFAPPLFYTHSLQVDGVKGVPLWRKRGKKKKHIIVRVFGAAAQADGRGEVAVDIGMCSLRLSDRSWWIATGGRRWLRTVLQATGCECRVARGGGQSERIHTYVRTYHREPADIYAVVSMYICTSAWTDSTGQDLTQAAKRGMPCALWLCA